MTAGLWSILIQGSGSAAAVLASLWVAWQLGLPAQGEFALLRSWTDALTVVLCLGLPQGLLHLSYREGVPVAALQGFVLRTVAVVALVIALVVALAAVLFTGADRAVPAAATTVGRESLLLVALALPFWVAHLLWRSLTLRSRGVLPYALLTALPAWLVLAGVGLLVAAGSGQGFAWVLLGAGSCAALVAAAVVRADRRQPAPWPRRTMWSVSLQTWGQGLAAAWMPALLLSLAALGGAGLGEVGALSLGLHVYQLFAVAAAYAAPQVYDQAARGSAPPPGQVLAAWGRRVGWWLPLLATAVALALPWMASAWWPALRGHEPGLAALALAGLLAVLARLWATLLQAAGRIRELSWQALARVLLACALTLAWTPSLGALLAVPLALLATEALTLVQMAVTERTRARR
ncbi:MAG: hypothetical protein KF683_18130 [Rubrivivax sp.]|nr:hypothetical protein [Rubrivivax sp.]